MERKQKKKYVSFLCLWQGVWVCGNTKNIYCADGPVDFECVKIVTSPTTECSQNVKQNDTMPSNASVNEMARKNWEEKSIADEKGETLKTKSEDNANNDNSAEIMTSDQKNEKSYFDEKDKLEFVLCRWDSNNQIASNWVHVSHFQHKQIETPPSESASMAYSVEPTGTGIVLRDFKQNKQNKMTIE
ncbi:hypothetical protein RFI_11706 [Reticulomyxa filosa]|uniref:Uncharacterized protein n=1 Tax=Reticulomyxa filosa TaxID=46433 RepID=X6NHR7_RETFI|nr:hypothetical protein RFI_11706 [Reticulomyxa filosa]|eukprot:ETO25433.1 hypothetical protein RFI_11706 [Reticulomyxa filosa]